MRFFRVWPLCFQYCICFVTVAASRRHISAQRQDAYKNGFPSSLTKRALALSLFRLHFSRPRLQLSRPRLRVSTPRLHVSGSDRSADSSSKDLQALGEIANNAPFLDDKVGNLERTRLGLAKWAADVLARIENFPTKLQFLDEIRDKAPSLDNSIGKLERNSKLLMLLRNSDSEIKELLPDFDDCELVRIRKALEVAFLAHVSQRRRSGEPYIIHPVAVAKILAEGKMDCDSVVSGLLHDTIEDTDLTFNELEDLFGLMVRKIVQGETEASKVSDTVDSNFDAENPLNEDAENLRSLFVAMASDRRIVIVKLADRLHNMQTLEHMPKPKQEKKANETMELYVPLARRLGLWEYKTKLSDLCFKYLKPDEDASMSLYLKENNDAFDNAVRSVNETLESVRRGDDSLSFEMSYRIKDRYSIWLKMQRRNSTIDKLRDLVAVRLVLDTDDDYLCYILFSKLTNALDAVPGTFKDYIKDPKPNGYQSLHTTFRVKGQFVELQIRTNSMHHIAEYGEAAHWLYKDKVASPAWIECSSNIQALNYKSSSAEDFLEGVNKKLTDQSVFVRLRNGTIRQFSKGATVQDFIEELGVKEKQRVRVNNKIAGCTTKLQNNDEMTIENVMPNRRPTILDSVFTSLFGTVRGKSFSICEECYPLPGDDVCGTEKEGSVNEMFIHRKFCHCERLESYKKRTGRVGRFQEFSAPWDTKYYDIMFERDLRKALVETKNALGMKRFRSKFVAFSKDRPGLLEEISDKISAVTDEYDLISGIRPEVLGTNTAVEIRVDVAATEELMRIMQATREVEDVQEVRRGSIDQLLYSMTRSDFWRLCEPS